MDIWLVSVTEPIVYLNFKWSIQSWTFMDITRCKIHVDRMFILYFVFFFTKPSTESERKAFQLLEAICSAGIISSVFMDRCLFCFLVRPMITPTKQWSQVIRRLVSHVFDLMAQQWDRLLEDVWKKWDSYSTVMITLRLQHRWKSCDVMSNQVTNLTRIVSKASHNWCYL